MRRARALPALLALLGGCGSPAPGKSLVLLAVGGSAVCVDHLALTVTLANGARKAMPMVPPATRPFAFPPSQTFALEFDAGVTGMVHLQLDAVAADNETLASATGDATIDPAAMPIVVLTLTETGFHKMQSGITDGDFRAVYAAPGEVIAVGLRPNAQDSTRALAVRSTDRGCSWTPMKVGSTNGFWAIGGADGHLYIAGEQDTIFHRVGGGTFDVDTTPSDGTDFYGIAKAPGGDAFAVGTSSSFYYRSNNMGTWTTEVNPTNQDAGAVYAISPTLVYAVGDGGSVARGPGTWTPINTLSSSPFDGFWASGPTDLWIAGEDNSIYRGTGNDSFVAFKDTGVPLFAVWGFSSKDVYLVGDVGTIVHFDGSMVAPIQQTGAGDGLYGVAGDGADLYVVGAKGTIVRGP